MTSDDQVIDGRVMLICNMPLTDRDLHSLQVNAPKVATIITVSNAIQNAEFLSPTQQHIMVKKLLEDSQ